MHTVAVMMSAGMFAFSAWTYGETGDWVALVFMAMSVGYGALFAVTRLSRRGSSDGLDE